MVRCTYLDAGQNNRKDPGFDIVLTNHARAVVFIVRLAVLALHARLNLCSNTNTVTNLAGCDSLSNCDDFPNDLVSYAERSN